MCVSLCVYPCFYQGSSLCVKDQNCMCSTVNFAFSYTRWRHIFFFNIRARKLVKKSGLWKYNHNSFIYFSRIIPTDFLLFSQRLADRSIWLISYGTSPLITKSIKLFFGLSLENNLCSILVQSWRKFPETKGKSNSYF